MSMFGANIYLEPAQFSPRSSFEEQTVNEALKRNDERAMFQKFLDSSLSSGQTVQNSLIQQAQASAQARLDSGEVLRPELLVDFVLDKLKSRQNAHLNAHQHLIRQIIEAEEPHFAKLHSQVDQGTFDGKLPFGYPDIAKKAEGMLRADIKDSISRETAQEYLIEKIYTEQVRALVKTMFYAINKFSLSGENLVSYQKVLYELSLVQTDPIENESALKQEIARALTTGEALNLIYIKSLRYTYPDGKRMIVLDHLEQTETNGLDPEEKRVYFDEHILLSRLNNFKNIFSANNIPVKLTILVADNDLEILFPEDNGFVPSSDVSAAKKAAKRYILALQKAAPNLTSEVYLLADYLAQTNLSEPYTKAANLIYSDIKRGGQIVKDSDLEDRVNYRYEFFSSLYGTSYSRIDARETMTHQIAHLMALSEVFEHFNGLPIVVTNSRGRENKLIGGLNPGSRAAIFTKLKEPTITQKIS